MPVSADASDLVRWALSESVPNSRQIGTHAVGRVLVALTVYADARLELFPSTQTLADDVSGLNRRDVRNALALLSAEGLIEDTGRKRGRSTVWRLSGFLAWAGNPADPSLSTREGYPADVPAGASAGKLAGALVGYPAAKGTEEKKITRTRGWTTCEQHTDDTNPASHCRICLSEVSSDPWRPSAFVGKVWYPEVRELA